MIAKAIFNLNDIQSNPSALTGTSALLSILSSILLML